MKSAQVSRLNQQLNIFFHDRLEVVKSYQPINDLINQLPIKKKSIFNLI